MKDKLVNLDLAMFGSHPQRLEVLWLLGPTKALRVRDYFYGVGSQDVRHE